ncbi:hypothetical protein [Bifidobacterium samirii]|uniref:Uncharacterized protein n=1 Tax=Bifidobacterium samirii TaxID=2306974 RepID=A0A430FUA2_9BIFI|nr:hypothetical protein [Bifidobacterium samirii]RSX56733.1 hypothetical protein D2E24_1023 [Bifidobacterium samirii]
MFSTKSKPAPMRTAPSDVTSMEVYFSGPAVDAHSMSVRDLAPALLGLSDAIDRYRELSCPFVDLDFRITATRAGSFDVVLQLLGTLTNLVQGANPADVVQLASGFMDVIKILTTRFRQTGDVKPGPSETIRQTGTRVRMEWGSFHLDVDHNAYIASRDGKIINSIGAASQPATLDGYDPVRFIHRDSDRQEEIDARASTAMSDLNLSDQPIAPSTETTTLQIDTIQTRSAKWKFRKGDETFWCEIQDQNFLNRWRNHQEPFFNDDLLRVDLETDQYIRDGQLRTGDRRITKVHEHIPIEPQPTLDL